MKIETLERYIRHTAIPYGTLLERAKKGGLTVHEIPKSDGVVQVFDSSNKCMTLFFESTGVYKENRDNGLIMTKYNYSK